MTSAPNSDRSASLLLKPSARGGSARRNSGVQLVRLYLRSVARIWRSMSMLGHMPSDLTSGAELVEEAHRQRRSEAYPGG